MSTLFYLSARRLAANQENARKSTGPRTPQGKARSSQNASTQNTSTHNIFSGHLLQEGESEPLFRSLRENLLRSLFPDSFLELAAADRIIDLHWQLQRLASAQRRLNLMQNLLYHQQLQKEQENIENKRQAHLEDCDKHNLDSSEDDLESLGLSDFIDPDSPPLQPDPGFFIAQALFTSHEQKQRITPHERLINLQQKLHAMLSRAMKDYRQLQIDRRQQEARESEEEDDGREPYCRYLDPTHSEDPEPDQADQEHHDDDTIKASTNPDGDPASDHRQQTTDPRAAAHHKAQPRATTSAPNRKIEPTCQNDAPSSNPFHESKPPNQEE